MKAKSLHWVLTAVLLVLFFGLSGCTRVEQAIERADAVVTQAREAGAESKAPDEFMSAEQLLTQARDEYKNWKFKQAESSANTSEAQARLALERSLKADKAAGGTGLKTGDEGEWGDTSSIFGSTITEGSAQLPPLRDIHFSYDESRLTAEANSIMADNARWIKSHPGLIIEVEGHCDERGTEEYNIALGQRRAASARSYLENYGVDSSRLRTISYGEAAPMDSGSSEAAWAQNRRAHFVVSR